MAGLVLVACGSETSSPAPQNDMSVRTETATAASKEPPELAKLSAAPEIDPGSGLIIDEGWELVRGHCAACHSAKLVTQNRGTRDTWEGMIRWMQETQGLWPLAENESLVLDYLAGNYGPLSVGRRRPLPPELLPPP